MTSRYPWSNPFTGIFRISVSSVAHITILICLLGLPPAHAAPEAVSPSVDAGRYYEDALRLFAEESYRQAVIQLKNALQQDTGHMPARVLLGRAYLATGYPRQAEVEFLNAKKMGADRLLIDIPLARTYNQLGKFNELLAEIDPTGHVSAEAAQIEVLRGRAYMGLAQYEQAEEAFSTALRIDPQVEGALTGQAIVYLSQGKIDQAKAVLDESAALNPAAAETWFLKGRIAYHQKQLRPAVAYFTQALEADPEYSEARVTRVACLLDLGQLEQAQQDLDLLMAQPVAEPMANYLQAVVHSRNGDSAKAKQSLALAMNTLDSIPPELLASNPQIMLLAGTITYDQGNFEAAGKHLESYLTRYPGHARARQMMTRVLLVRNQPDKAREVLAPLIVQRPDDPALQLLMGQIHLALGDSAAAARLFSRVAARRPDDAAMQMQLAQSLIQAGQIAGAIDILQQAHRLGGGTGATGVMLAALLLEQGENDQAIAVAESVIAGEPGNLQAINILGLGRLANGNLAGARAAFDRASEIDAAYLPTRLNLGRVDIREGVPQRAKQRYQALLQDNPRQREVLLALAELESSMGNPEQASRWLEKLHDFYPGEIEPGLGLIELHLNNGKPERALTVAQDLQNQHPEDYRVGMALGISEMAAGKREDARLSFRNLSQQVFNDAGKLHRIADYQRQLGDLESAHETLARAVELAPGWLSATVDLALLEIRMGRMDDALGRALKLQVMLPDRNEGPFLEGEVHLAEKNFAKAEQAYLRAWEMKPDSVTTMRLYQLRKLAGRQDASVQGLEAWERGHPDDLVVKAALAREMIQSGRYDEARESYQQLLTLRPGDPELLNALAMLYQMTADPRALKTAQHAYRLSPENPYIADTLGWVLVSNGDPEKGLRFLREAQLRLSDLPDIGYHLARALHALNRDSEARDELNKALRNESDFIERVEAEALLKRLSGDG